MTSSNPDPNNTSADSMSEDNGGEAIKQKVKEDVREAKHEAGVKAREQAEAGQHRVADEANKLSDAIDAAASSLDDDDREDLARYARKLSSSLANAAGGLEDRSVNELANDAKHLARNNPGLFMLGSIAVGFGLSRFFKASAENDHRDDEDENSEYNSGDDNFSTSTSMQQRDRNMSETGMTSTTPDNSEGRNMP